MEKRREKWGKERENGEKREKREKNSPFPATRRALPGFARFQDDFDYQRRELQCLSYHIVSHRIVSYRIVSYRIVSYHMIRRGSHHADISAVY